MTTLNMMSDIEFESDNDDQNCLSVDELMNAVDNNSQFKTTKSDSVNHIQQQELLPLNALNSTGTSTELVVYSDGCTAQNRNCVMSNALLHLSIKYNISITQKFLEKGHTQMECDSVHSVIERKLKKSDYYLPSQLSQLTKEARSHPFPYISKLLQFDFFSDYSNKKLMFYESIRPGNIASDPVVTELRVIQYCPSGIILYKINYNDSFKELPRRPKKIDPEHILKFPKLHQSSKKISLDKWNDLQSLRSIMPYDCHSFYDALPHMDYSVRKNKKSKGKD